ncbi:MAG: hypothetical protein Q8L66_10845 [Caulobacter sp.]|nr:hypothetical protein [Caulobacter sp.]
MTDEAQLLEKRLAYIAELRGLNRHERLIGFVLILVGFLLVLPAQWVLTWPHMVIWIGYGLVAVGWILFIHVIWRRNQWRRANPFDPDA